MQNNQQNGTPDKTEMKSYARLFPDDRCLHAGESEIRQIQLVQLRMLKILDAVCKDHGITYWLDAGTLLGAIRHKGFIPWDDDVDIVMPRPDYDRFVKIAPTLFCEDIFFQHNQTTDSGYNFFWSKLRDRRSTAMDDFECEHPSKYHMGIALDVFCFDGSDDLDTYYKRKRFMNYEYSNKRKRAAMRMLRNMYTLFLSKSKWIHKLNREYARTYERSSYLIKSFDCIFKGHFSKEVVFPLTTAEFEGNLFPVPGNWDSYLKTSYGDYMQLPPLKEQQIRRHFKKVDFNHACEWDKQHLVNTPQDFLHGNFFLSDSCNPQKLSVGSEPLHLVYVYFGSRVDHIRQIRLSIASWVERSDVRLCIHLVTDQIVQMESYLTQLKEANPEVLMQIYLHAIPNDTLTRWKGKHAFMWRVKMKALEYVQKQFPTIPFLYLDGDTYLRHSASTLLAKLNAGIPLMHLNEGPLSKKPSKTERLMWKKMKGDRVWSTAKSETQVPGADNGFAIVGETCMWNAGLIGLPAVSAATLIEQSIDLCDVWLDAKIRPRLLEQFAFSVALAATGRLEAADDQVGHYWSNKEAFNF